MQAHAGAVDQIKLRISDCDCGAHLNLHEIDSNELEIDPALTDVHAAGESAINPGDGPDSRRRIEQRCQQCSNVGIGNVADHRAPRTRVSSGYARQSSSADLRPRNGRIDDDRIDDSIRPNGAQNAPDSADNPPS